jgi:8-oxo-dGTP diphosphatase
MMKYDIIYLNNTVFPTRRINTKGGRPMNGKLRNMASIYITDRDKMLMLYRIGSRVVSPSWCGIGGHFESPELNDARACVLRELKEEIGLEEENMHNIELRYITLRLKNGEVRQNYYFFAELKENVEVKLECSEGKPEWISLVDINKLDMPFTASYVLRHYMETGRYAKSLYGGIAVQNGVEFTELNEF